MGICPVGICPVGICPGVFVLESLKVLLVVLVWLTKNMKEKFPPIRNLLFDVTIILQFKLELPTKLERI